MPAKPPRKTTRKATRSVSRKAPAVIPARRLNKARKALEKAAANYAQLANRAGVAAKKAAKKWSRSRTAKVLTGAALAVAGYVALRAGRKR